MSLLLDSRAAPKSMVAVTLAGRTSGALQMAAAGRGMASLVPPLTPGHGAPPWRILPRGKTLVSPPASRARGQVNVVLERATAAVGSSCPQRLYTVQYYY